MTRLLIYILLFIPAVNLAQFGNQDFGIWGGVGVEKKVNKKVALDGTIEFRTENNATSLKQFYAEFGSKYKVNKHFICGLYWRPKFNNGDYSYEFQNRFHLDLTGKFKTGKLSFYIRSRTQELVSANKTNDLYERFRLKMSMKLQDGLKMFIQDELFMLMNSPKGVLYDKNRFTVGMEYEVNKLISVSLKYLRITEVNVYYPLKMNVVAVKLGFTL